MKVFEVRFEYSIGDEKEITQERSYWTGDWASVCREAMEHAYQYDKQLMMIADVLNVTRHCKDPIPPRQQQEQAEE